LTRKEFGIGVRNFGNTSKTLHLSVLAVHLEEAEMILLLDLPDTSIFCVCLSPAITL
jgi:hypothetical protein